MSLPVCKYFSINQTCRFGKHCKFAHIFTQRPPPEELKSSGTEHDNGDLNHTESVYFEKPEQSGLFARVNSGSKDDRIIEGRRKDKDLHLNNETSDSTSSQRRLCSFYSSHGWCKYGKNCIFIHFKQNTNSRPSTSDLGRRSQEKKYDLPPRFHAKESKGTLTQNENKAPAGTSTSAVGSQSCQGSREDDHVQHKAQAQKSCIYFKAGHCKWGKNCKFFHNTGNVTLKTRHAPERDRLESAKIDDNKVKSSVPKLCVYYKNGRCRQAKKCKYSHELENNSLRQGKENILCESQENLEDEKVTCEVAHNAGSNEDKVVHRPRQIQFGLKQTFTLVELDELDVVEIRKREIEAIKRRFSKDKIECSEGQEFIATIKFEPSDPDWPFDVKDFLIKVSVPAEYPKQTLTVTVPLEQDLPATVQRYLEITIQEWLHERQEQLSSAGKVELVFRPFLRWLDRSIEEITTEALKQLKRELTAKSMGLEFIPAKRLQEKFKPVTESSEAENPASGIDEDDSETDDGDSKESNETSSDEEEDQLEEMQTLELQPQQRGTEISLKHLQLKENAAALIFQRLKVILQCSRCKGHEDVYVSQGSVTSLTCGKCNNNMFTTYRPGLLHQFSSVLGYLDVDGCQAFDLILQDCRASVSCMSCNKQTSIDGLVTGQLIDGWCKACNAKFKLAAEAVKLAHLAPSGVDTSAQPIIEVSSSKPKKPPKDPSIREGYPLPDFGTCKHYKHSYRWLRFPCCGKAYPCDVCHDKKEDHEMVLANRMICGHCCKEQNFSASRPCSGCGQHLTKVRSAHWEGGSGCRDRISMSKGDTQKYKNMNKTISNKKKLESKPKKKNTKLRHS